MHDDGLHTRLAIRLAAGALVLACTLAPAAARAESSNQLAAQVGWWNTELEFDASFGVYAAAGLAWFHLLRDETGPKLHAEAAVGYRYRFDNGLGLGAGVRAVTPCNSGWCDAQMFEVGLRYEIPGGAVMGLNVPLIGTGRALTWGSWPFPFSLLLSQFYLGMVWDL